jgi:hypothetical protein
LLAGGDGRTLYPYAATRSRNANGAGQAPMQNASVAVKATDFLRPAAPGRLRGHGRVVRRDADIAFLEAELEDANGATVAKASATARVVEMDSGHPIAPTSARATQPVDQSGQIGT